MGHISGSQIVQSSGPTRENRLMDRAAADALGISRVTLYKKMKKYGLMAIPLHSARAQ